MRSGVNGRETRARVKETGSDQSRERADSDSQVFSWIEIKSWLQKFYRKIKKKFNKFSKIKIFNFKSFSIQVTADDIFKQFFGDSNFGEDGIRTTDFFDTILEKTNRTPYIFLFTSPWCTGCQAAKRIGCPQKYIFSRFFCLYKPKTELLPIWRPNFESLVLEQAE